MDKCNISTKDLAGEIRKAKKAGLLADKTEPRAVAVKYDRKSDRVVVDLRSGVSFMFPTSLAEGLSDASSDELAQVKVLADGFAIFWESIDVVLSVPDLLMGVFGSKTWMARPYTARCRALWEHRL